ncbi:hypothetical protein SAMN02982997_00108 [Legionella micdadei]|uniref:Uncharacterized protein n=1 Tax=Legionella micdadei TaxID=451 RepID=A0A1G5AS53_LEGMI|nr:hypothetical protein SAMN02982997_00108 [Legionella micdadei]
MILIPQKLFKEKSGGGKKSRTDDNPSYGSDYCNKQAIIGKRSNITVSTQD